MMGDMFVFLWESGLVGALVGAIISLFIIRVWFPYDRR